MSTPNPREITTTGSGAPLEPANIRCGFLSPSEPLTTEQVMGLEDSQAIQDVSSPPSTHEPAEKQEEAPTPPPVKPAKRTKTRQRKSS